MIARLQALVLLLVLRRENRRLDRADQRPPLPHRKPAPLDPRDVDLWARQILTASPDQIMQELGR